MARFHVPGFLFIVLILGSGLLAQQGPPLPANQSRSFEATGGSPLELMAIGIVKDAARRFQIVGRNPYVVTK